MGSSSNGGSNEGNPPPRLVDMKMEGPALKEAFMNSLHEFNNSAPPTSGVFQKARERGLAYFNHYELLANLTLSLETGSNWRRGAADECAAILESVWHYYGFFVPNAAKRLGLDPAQFAPSAGAYSQMQLLVQSELADIARELAEKFAKSAIPWLERLSKPKEAARVDEKAGAKFGLVMNGGGVKGLAFVGAMLELQKRVDITFDSYCGTSAGAIAAAIFAMGYAPADAEKIIRNQSFKDFLWSSWKPNWSASPLAPPDSSSCLWRLARELRVLLHLAISVVLGGLSVVSPRAKFFLFSSAPIGRFLNHLMMWRPRNGITHQQPQEDPLMTFGALAPNRLTVIAASTGSPHRVVFNHEKDKIEFSVRASMAIPGFFESMDSPPDRLYDGGVVANFAFNEFARTSPHKHVLGFFLRSGIEPSRWADRPAGPLSVLASIVEMSLGQDDATVLKENPHRIIVIDTEPIGTTDFGLSETDKNFLIETGRLGVLRFLHEQKDSHKLHVRVPTTISEDYEKQLQLVTTMRESAKRRWYFFHLIQKTLLWAVLALAVFALFRLSQLIVNALQFLRT